MTRRFALTLFLLVAVHGCNERVSIETRSQGEGPAGFEPLIPDVPSDQESVAGTKSELDAIPLKAGEVTRTVFEASIIDTADFENPIQRRAPFAGEIRSTSRVRPEGAEEPQIVPGPGNRLHTMGHLTQRDRVHFNSNFPGISQSFFTPPDPTLAVGPNHIVQMVNSEIAFFTKDGTVQFQVPLGDQGDPGFFEDIGAEDFCVDPRCFYDHYAERFVVLCLEVYLDTGESYLTIAVSDDDDPNGIWFRYRPTALFNVGGLDNFADYPSFGYDVNGYYISGNLFTFGFSFSGIGFRTMEKTPLLSGQPIVVNDFMDTGFFTIQMAQTFGATMGSLPYGVTFNGSDNATLVAINDPFGAASTSLADVPIPSFSSSGNAVNQGGSVSTVGGRSMNAHVRDGKLYTCHSIDDGGRSIVRWYEFQIGDWPQGPAPTLLQSGDIDLGGGQNTFFPAIYSNAQGSVAVVFARSSPNDLISVQAAGRLAGDPPGTLGAPVEFDVSTTSAFGRYGDYFDIAIDASDDLTFWTVGQTSENFGWDTVVNSFTLPVLGDVNCDGEVNLLDVAPFVELISGGGFSDKADLNQDGVVNLLDVDPFISVLTGG